MIFPRAALAGSLKKMESASATVTKMSPQTADRVRDRELREGRGGALDLGTHVRPAHGSGRSRPRGQVDDRGEAPCRTEQACDRPRAHHSSLGNGHAPRREVEFHREATCRPHVRKVAVTSLAYRDSCSKELPGTPQPEPGPTHRAHPAPMSPRRPGATTYGGRPSRLPREPGGRPRWRFAPSPIR